MRVPPRWCFVFACALAVVTHSAAQPAPAGGQAAPSHEEPWDRSGTGSGALINGLQSALQAANVDVERFDLPSIYSRYAATYGPYIETYGFSIKTFVKGPMGIVLKFAASLLLAGTFLLVFFRAHKGQASAGDLAWSLVKTLLCILYIALPGVAYVGTVALPMAFAQMLAKGSAAATQLTNGTTLQLQLSQAVNDGVREASAEVKGAMAHRSESSAQLICSLAAALNKFATDVNGSPPGELVKVPAPDQNGTYTIQDVTGSTKADQILAIQVQFGRLMSSVDGNWPNWREAERKKLGDLAQAAQTDIRDSVADPEAIAKRLKKLRLDALEAARSIFVTDIIERGAVFGSDAHSLEQEGMLLSAGFVQANRDEESFGDRWITGIGRYLVGWCMPLVARAWLLAVEIVLLNLILMAPFWIHPSTAKHAETAMKYVIGVVMWLPIYLPCYLIIERLLCAMFPAAPGGFIAAVTWVQRAVMSSVFAAIAPIAAVFLTFAVFKMFKTGGSLIGVGLKGAMTSVGMMAVTAVPALRVAAIASSRAMSGHSSRLSDRSGRHDAAAGEAAAQASQARETNMPLSGAEMRARARAWGNRGAASGFRHLSRGLSLAARGTDYAQDALGTAFGANDKYINREQTFAQRVSGAKAAMGAAALHGTIAMASGGKTSHIIQAVERRGEERQAREKNLEQKHASVSAADAISAQKRAAEQQMATMQRLEAFLAAQYQAQSRVASPSTGAQAAPPPPPPAPPRPPSTAPVTGTRPIDFTTGGDRQAFKPQSASAPPPAGAAPSGSAPNQSHAGPRTAR